MPSQFLTQAEKEQWESFPAELDEVAKTAFFTLTDSDLALIKRRTGAHNQLGFALLLCSLRFLGFISDNLGQIPADVCQYLTQQLHLADAIIPTYPRIRTKQNQINEILAYTGFRRIEKNDWARLAQWLTKRALEHDQPRFLLRLVSEKLLVEKICRPGLSVLERLVLYLKRSQFEHP